MIVCILIYFEDYIFIHTFHFIYHFYLQNKITMQNLSRKINLKLSQIKYYTIGYNSLWNEET